MAPEKRIVSCILLVVMVSGSIGSSNGFQFKVGGRQGWVVNPYEKYNHWAERNRFQVNDTLFFKYQKGSDSVLVVTKDDYEKCNISKPIVKLEDANSIFKFDRSGPFFFISGLKPSCDKGQKLIVVVLAVRNPPPPPVPAPAPAPLTPAPSPQAPAPPPKAPAPAPRTSGARPPFTPSAVLMSAVSLVLSMSLGVFVM